MASGLFRSTKHAKLYSKFRPSPPEELILSIVKYVGERFQPPFKQAVDIGCGSGQSTLAIAPYFENVMGLDVSDAQIEAAKKDRNLPNVNYRVADCYNIPSLNASVQLVTLSQSVHWFDLDKLFTEIKRILVPNGVVAAFGYWIPFPQMQDAEKTAAIRSLVGEDLHDKYLGEYWNKERYVVQSKYSKLSFPFQEVQRLSLFKESESSLSDYLGYLCTWSSYQKLLKEDSTKAERIMKDIEDRLINILNPGKSANEIELQLKTEFFMLIGHK